MNRDSWTFDQNVAIRWSRRFGVAHVLRWSMWHWKQPDGNTECGRVVQPGQPGTMTSGDPNKVECKICRNSPSCQGALKNQP